MLPPPLHIASTLHLDNLLFLLFPTTVVIGVALEKMRVRRQQAGDAAPPTVSEEPSDGPRARRPPAEGYAEAPGGAIARATTSRATADRARRSRMRRAHGAPRRAGRTH